MKKTDLAYTAGIIDGEGCISLHGRKNTHGIYLAVSVGNTNEWLIQWLKFSYGGGIYTHQERRNWKPAWQWIISGKNALDFLELLYPYLRLKKPQAEIAIRFQRAKEARKKTRPLSGQAKVVEEAERILMASLNKKGTA